MAALVIVYWRDIPAQILVREGRQRERRQLPDRFEQSIDRAAMKAGLKDSDSYLAEWRRADPVEEAGTAAAVADAALARLDDAYPLERLLQLISNLGRES